MFVPGKPVDGGHPNKSVPARAVNLGVKAIQKTLNAEGVPSKVEVDGFYGQATADAVSWYQTEHGLTVDGAAGAKTCLLLWTNAVKAAAVDGVDPKWLYGQMVLESSGDPGACGLKHEPDRGLVQINTAVYTDVSLAQAHDPEFALKWAASRFKLALDKYSGQDADLSLRSAILEHNSPTGAAKLAKTGEYKSDANKTYVEAVMREADGWVG